MEAVKEQKALDTVEERTTEEIEVPVVSPEEWQKKVKKGIDVIAAITKHCQFEASLQGREISVGSLCPEQKESLAEDLTFLVEGK
ncbi:MAG: hypothetical protein WCV58_00955 [Patescibacteria group bacterium]